MSATQTSLCLAAAILLSGAGSPTLAAESEPLRLDFRSPGWELEGDDTVVEELDGKVALRLKSGRAIYRGVEFLDGTIEFDLQVTELRSFAYVYFRMESEDEHEEFYFRPHKSRLPDAIQYSPVYKGSSQWQLYHDARSTAAAHIPAGEWIPVKVVVEGRRAAVFVGKVDKPQLVVPALAREPKAGYIALRSFMTFGTPAGTYVANYADVVVQPGVVDFDFDSVAEAAAEPDHDQIWSWQVSPAFAPAAGDVLALPQDLPVKAEWRTVSANRDGRVELERWVDRPEGVRRASVAARLELVADQPGSHRLDLGFSDEVSVFLNGRLLVVDDESYSFNLPRRQGLWTPAQLSVFLPLERGTNELIVVITDRFGGWALSGRFAAVDGVSVASP